MKAAELVVRCLENEGVQYIFGVPGEEVMDILDALSDSPIAFIPTRHEQGAAFMADVYGRLSGCGHHSGLRFRRVCPCAVEPPAGQTNRACRSVPRRG